MKTKNHFSEMRSPSWLRLIYIGMLSLLSIGANAQAGTAVTMTLQGAMQTAANTFEYDMMITNTGTTALALRGYTWGINHTPGLANGGSITHSYIVGSRDNLFTALPAASVTYVSSVNQLRATTTNAAAGLEVALTAGMSYKLGRMIVSTSAASFPPNFNPWLPGTGLTTLQLVTATGRTQCVATVIVTPPGTSYLINGTANSPATGTLQALTGVVSPLPTGATPFILNPCPNSATIINNIVSNTGCNGSAGSITVNVTGNTGPYLYSKNGAGNQASNTFSNLTAATYSINVTDGSGCVTTSTAVVGTDAVCDIACEHYDVTNAPSWTSVVNNSVSPNNITNPVNINNLTVNFNAVPSGTDDRMYRSIPTLPNAWVTDFEFKPVSGSVNGVAASLLCFTAGTLTPYKIPPSGGYTSQDFIEVNISSPSSSSNYLTSTTVQAAYKDGATAPVNSTSIPITYNTNYYARLERITTTTVLLSIFSNAARTIHIAGSPVVFCVPSTVTGLNTLQHATINTTGANYSFSGTVDNVCIKNGPNTLCPFNSDFTFTGGSYCNGSIINVTSNSPSTNTGTTWVNQWLFYEVATGTCNEIGNPLPAFPGAATAYYGNTMSVTLNASVFLPGHCYALKHGIYSNCAAYCATKKCFCIDPPINTLTATACGAYTWNGATYTLSGVYTYTTYNAPCVLTSVLNLTINPPPTIVLSGTSPICAGETVTIGKTGAATYTITPGATFTPTPLVTTTYTVTGTDAIGCTNTATKTIVVNQCGVKISPKVFLSGPYNTSTGMMNDNLRTCGLIPLTEPYTAAPYSKQVIGEPAGETTTASVLSAAGPTAIVDWIFLELRSTISPYPVVATKRALLRRDGNVVSTDGISAVFFPNRPTGNYYVSIKHRNHLGVMTANAVALSYVTVPVDFTSGSVWLNPSLSPIPPYNVPRRLQGAVYTLWSGDANTDKKIKYSGIANDKDPIALIANLYGVYRREDLNMDCNVLYNGVGNDKNVISSTILACPQNPGMDPGYVIYEHTP